MAQPTVTPGNLVVPLSEIIDRLQGKLSAADLNALLLAVVERRRSEVRPGDLITADLMNQILGDLAELQGRVAELEQSSSGGGTAQPAVGFIDVSHKGGARGMRIVPGNTDPLPQTFGILNATDQLLRIKLTASITAAHGSWTRAALFENGSDTVTVTVPSEGSIEVDVLCTAPNAAVVGDIATLAVTAEVGAPHNKRAETSAELTVALSEGPPVTATLVLGDIRYPADFKPADLPAGVDGRVPRTSERTINYPFKYDTQDPAEDPGFELTAALSEAAPGGALGSWAVQIGGATADSDQTAGGVRTLRKRVSLTPGLFSNIGVKLIAPDADTQFKLAVSMRSTLLAGEIAEEVAPIVIESK